jgi:ligand-binding SRPBCC domain-containing protein
MNIFWQAFQVNAPVEKVAFFNRDARVLKTLPLPPLFVKLNYVGPIPIRWRAIHSEIDSIAGFKDTQLEGPFSSREYRHSFQAIHSETTQVNHEIRAELSRHPYRAIVCKVLWINLPILFAYRTWKNRQRLEQ